MPKRVWPIPHSMAQNFHKCFQATPFSESLHGYLVSGESDGAESGSASIGIPESLGLNSEAVVDGDLSFTETQFSAGEIIAGTAPSAEFSVHVHGLTMNGQGISFTRAGGLRLDFVTLVVETAPGVTRDFTYENVGVAGPPLYLLESAVRTETEPFDVVADWTFAPVSADR